MASDAEGLTKTPNLMFCAATAAPALSKTNSTHPLGDIQRPSHQPLAGQQEIHTKHWESEGLLVRVQRQEPEALAELFDKYCRLVFSIGQRVLRSTTEAEDLVQDVFLFLWSRSELFVPGKRPAHDWIIRVIYHRAFDRRRYLITRLSYNFGGEGRAGRDSNQENTTDRLSRIVSNEENFGELLYWKSYLEAAFDELSKAQRETLKLFFYEGYTLAEISAKLDEPLVNVRNHYYRGLRRLEKHVDGNDK